MKIYFSMNFFEKVDLFLENQRLKKELKLKEDELITTKEDLKLSERRFYSYQRVQAACAHCIHGLPFNVEGQMEIGCDVYQNNVCKSFERKP